MASIKILIVDDDPDITEAMRVVLENRGYQVDSAADSVKAMKRIAAQRPDLIILDVMMDTHTAGFQLAQKLHGAGADPAHKAIPILMVTAVHQTTPLRFTPDEDYLPVDAFIEKPIDPRTLLAQVSTLLRQS